MAIGFPETYPEWRRCITIDCGIELTDEFIETRLVALRDPDDSHTAQFAKQYGDGYLQQVIEWFELAQSEAAASGARSS
ncbi:MAG: hypothetical protein AAF467_23280 [Actinomycetota bacterium]